jgi:lipopolysaccharide biosynthesis protein
MEKFTEPDSRYISKGQVFEESQSHDEKPPKEMVSLLVHIYYRESLQEFSEKISKIRKYVDRVYVNLVRENFFEFNNLAIPEDFCVVASPNKGKDIGGKLVLMARYLMDDKRSRYILMLHDKKSPQSPMAGFWSKNLFRIADPELIPGIIETFDKNDDAGIVCSSTYVRNEWNKKKAGFESSNDSILRQLIDQYHFKLTDHSYVAGTMFWVRSELFENFFTQHNPLNIVKTLEAGNIMDTQNSSLTHAWERMLSWICTSQNAKIYGV